MRKALVVGTSNSIMKGGWVDGFRASYKGEVDHLVLGGSPFWQFLGKLNSDNLEKYHDIVVDTSPNDESHGDQIGNNWLFEHLYKDFISILTSAARVTVLRIPAENFLESKPNKIGQSQQRVCTLHNAEYLDITPILLSNSHEDRYIDRLHPKLHIMYEVGVNLGTRLSKFTRQVQQNRPVVPIGYTEEELIGTNISSELVESTIIKARFTVLHDGQQGRLQTPKLCFGFFANLQNCNATIRLEGIGDRIDLSCHFEKRQKTTVSFVTIKGGIFLNTVSVVKPWHSKNYAMHSLVEHGPYIASIGPFLCYE